MSLENYEAQMAPARRRFEEGAVSRVLAPGFSELQTELFLIKYSSWLFRMTAPVEGWISAAGDRCIKLGWDELGARLRQHAKAEAGHHEMVERDVHRLVGRWNARANTAHLEARALLDAEPSAGVLAYHALHNDNIASDTPYAQVAIEYEIEKLPVQYGGAVIAEFTSKLGDSVVDCLEFLTKHIVLDVAHTGYNRLLMTKAIEDVDGSLPFLVRAGSQALYAYDQFLSDCLTWVEENLLSLASGAHERDTVSV